MYNKLFSKIVDSSIWLESESTRLVWLTFIAIMDQDGFVAMASIKNLARRANISYPKTAAAVRILEGPDDESFDPDNDGRRIERVPGGWMVLNAPKYRDLVSREVVREQTRARVQRFRAKKDCNGSALPETVCNGEALNVTPSETDVHTHVRTAATPRHSPSAQKNGKSTTWKRALAIAHLICDDPEITDPSDRRDRFKVICGAQGIDYGAKDGKDHRPLYARAMEFVEEQRARRTP